MASHVCIIISPSPYTQRLFFRPSVCPSVYLSVYYVVCMCRGCEVFLSSDVSKTSWHKANILPPSSLEEMSGKSGLVKLEGSKRQCRMNALFVRWSEPYAPAVFFSRRGQIRGLGTKVPQQGPGMEPWWRLGQSPQKPTTGCENNAK